MLEPDELNLYWCCSAYWYQSIKRRRREMKPIIASGLTVMLIAGLALAQGNPQRRNQAEQQPPQQQAQQGEQTQQRRAPMPEEKSSVTHHSAHIGGQQINYTATAATYNIKADD